MFFVFMFVDIGLYVFHYPCDIFGGMGHHVFIHLYGHIP